MRAVLSLACLLASFASTACSTPAHELPLEQRPIDGAADYTFVFLKTGPERPADADTGRELMSGHFANMNRMAAAGDLLLAGPFGPGAIDPTLRGIFVIDRPEVEAGRALAATDPAVAAGVFELAALRWRGPAALRRMKALETELRAALPAAERDNPGATGRGFVLATCRSSDDARHVATTLGDAVVCGGPLEGAKDAVWLGAFDAETVDAAERLLERAGARRDAWTLLPWFASRALLDIDAPGLPQ